MKLRLGSRLLGGAAALVLATQAQATTCRQALALGLDVSGSVDTREYRLQTDGLANALRDPEVEAAFLAMPGLPVRLMVFEWSGLHDQRVVIPWTDVRDAGALLRIAGALNGMDKDGAQDGATAIAAAMLFGVQALKAQRDCLQWTLDLSGDGPANIGMHPMDITDADVAGVTINGLTVLPFSRANTTKNLTNVKTLADYYTSFVLRGPGAFVERASSFDDFSSAMRRKLLRELQLPNLSLDLTPEARDGHAHHRKGSRTQ
ncbi:MAG: DUF1194 domain-containing protein [Pseudomonadota bacterium]